MPGSEPRSACGWAAQGRGLSLSEPVKTGVLTVPPELRGVRLGASQHLPETAMARTAAGEGEGAWV